MTRLPPRYDLPKAAPQPLRLVQLFLNTRDAEHDRDWLATPDELADWLRKQALPVPTEISEADLERTRELREGLRALVAHEPRGVERVNAAMGDAAVRIRLRDETHVELEPVSDGIDAALARILAVVHAATADGTWPRLKTCAQCHWAFYDESRNRSATWCSMAICGNRRKTRAYRARRRA